MFAKCIQPFVYESLDYYFLTELKSYIFSMNCQSKNEFFESNCFQDRFSANKNFTFQLKITNQVVKKSDYKQSVKGSKAIFDVEIPDDASRQGFNYSNPDLIDNVSYLNCRDWSLKLCRL